MLKEIKNNLYCITSYTGNRRFVECDNEEELITYVAETEWKAENDRALESGDRILSAYETSHGKIWIITEWDRSVTTILFPSEY